MFQPIVFLKKCVSTNVYLKEILEDKPADMQFVVCAEYQNQGKGQGAKLWESEDAKNMLFSFNVNHQKLLVKDQFMFLAIIALSLLEFLKLFIPKERISIKWPNDIYVGNKKIAGVLIENTIKADKLASSIVGIGVNINQQIFVSDAPNPISLKNITNEEYNIETLLKKYLKSFSAQYSVIQNNDYKYITRKYLQNMYQINQTHKYMINNEIHNGIILGIDDYGFLLMKIADEIKTFDVGIVEYL